MVQRAGELLAEPDDRADIDKRFQHLKAVFKGQSEKTLTRDAKKGRYRND